MNFSKRTNWSTETNELSRLANSLKYDQIPVLDLTVSNPTKCGFQYLNGDLLKSLSTPKNLSYDPDAYGLSATREAICQYYAAKNIRVTPDQIILTASTSEAYSFVFRLLMESGDILLSPQPSYPLLDYLAALNDLNVKRYSLDQTKNWEINLSTYYARQLQEPKAVLVINPNNPTGNYLHKPELAEINLFCKNRSTAIISDEVFLDYPLSAAPENIATCAFNRHTLSFTLSGISKILGLPQMKLSWIVVSGPEAVAKEALKRLEVISDTYLSASTPTQNALPDWMKHQTSIQQEILQRVRHNYDFLKQTCSGGGPVRFFPVEGGWHAPLQLPAQHTDEEWACLFLKKEKVLTHPGYLFDFLEGSFLVLSLLVAEDTFKEGVKKILQAVKND